MGDRVQPSARFSARVCVPYVFGAFSVLWSTFVSAQVAPPTIQKSFGVQSIPLNGSTYLAFTVANPNASRLTGVGFTDPLPVGLVVSTPSGLIGACAGGSIVAIAGSSSISVTGAILGGGVPPTPCAFAVSVTGTTAGTKSNTTSAVTSIESGPGGTASASLVVGQVGIPTLQQWALWALGLTLIVAAGISFRLLRNSRRTPCNGRPFDSHCS